MLNIELMNQHPAAAIIDRILLMRVVPSGSPMPPGGTTRLGGTRVTIEIDDFVISSSQDAKHREECSFSRTSIWISSNLSEL